jgi:hypothetical protein
MKDDRIAKMERIVNSYAERVDALTAELEDSKKQLAVEVAVNFDYPDVVAERDALAKRVDELHQIADEKIGGMPEDPSTTERLVKERDRYLAALKAEVILAEVFSDEGDLLPGHSAMHAVGGITFRVSRKPDGTLEAEEV